MGLKSSVSIRGSRFFLCLLFLFVMSLLFGGREELSSLHHPKDFHTFGKNRFQRSSFYPHKTTESGTLRSSGIPICTAPGDQWWPAIYGDKIVWEDYRSDWCGDIYMYDLTQQKEIPICTAPGYQGYPAIYGDKIVWHDWRNDDGDIYMYDLTQQREIPICTAPGVQWSPAIYGDKIVWEDARNREWDIYMYDLTQQKEIPICTAPGDQLHPSIYGDKIVWHDWRNGGADIYMYDLTQQKEIPICTAPGDQAVPAIYGDKIVWEDYRNGGADIYMWGISFASLSASKSVDKPLALIGKELLYTIKIKNEGIQLLQNITVIDPIPQNAEYIEGSAIPAAIFDGQQLKWEGIALGAGEEKMLQFKVKTLSAGYIKNKAFFSHPTYQGLFNDTNIISTIVRSQVTLADWTVMVFIAADNDLAKVSTDDINAMEGVGSTDKVNIVVQRDLSSQCERLFIINHNGDPAKNSLVLEQMPSQNTGDPAVLTDFIKWSVTYYPAKHYALIIWDHGSGVRQKEQKTLLRGIAYDDTSMDYLDTIEMRQALEEAGVKLDFLGMDACLMQMAEVATEIKAQVNLVCASEEISYGWPFYSFLQQLVQNPTMDAVALGKAAVDAYTSYYSCIGRPGTLSLVSTSFLGELARCISSLGSKLSSLYSDPSARQNIDQAIKETLHFYYCDYKDLFHFAKNISRLVPEAKTEANELLALKDKVIVYNGQAFMDDATGLSIFLPKQNFSLYPRYYSSLLFGQMAPGWINFISIIVSGTAPPSDFSISKKIDKSEAVVGEELAYTITFENLTDQTLQDIIITDRIPPNTEYIEGSATGNPAYDPQTGELSWNIDSIAPHTSGNLTFKVKTIAEGSTYNEAILSYLGSLYFSNLVSTNVSDPNVITICTAPGDQGYPAIYGKKIVWMDARNGEWDIYMYDLTQQKEIPICTAPGDQGWPAIYGDKIVWEDYRNGGADIYMYDLTQQKEIPICTAPGYQGYPAIYGNKIVWMDARNGEWDIYLYQSEKEDTTPPSIKILSPLNGSKVSGSCLLSAKVTDPALEPESLQFLVDDVPLPQKITWDIQSGQFLTVTNITQTGTHRFKVRASDSWQNSSESEVSFEVLSQGECPPPPFTTIVLIGLPFLPSQSVSLQDILSHEKAYVWDKLRYILSDDPNFPENLAFKGIWVKTSQGFTPSAVNPFGSSISANQEVLIPLEKGWNIFTLPWTYTISLTGIMVEDKNGNRLSFSQAQDIVGLILFRWDGEKYCAVGPLNGLENTLYPWFGYWIMVKEDCKLVLPKEPWKVRAQRFSSKEGFCIPIKAISSDGKSEEVYIGIGKKEISSAFPPRAPYSSATRQISILKEEQSLFMDIRKEGGNQKWQIAVRGGTTLLFPNLSNLPKSHQIILTNGDKRYYLKTTSSVKVDSDKILEVEIGNGLITPLIINMIDTRTNRGGITISWSVNLDCQVKLGIRSLEGRLLKDLGVRSSSAGLNSLFWDGKGADGRPLPSGIYIVELTARDELNQMVKAIKGVILR
ncbi:MAG: clostripain-related cysteine peptidase [Sulfolobales archaeon]